MRACALASLVLLSCECVTILRRTIEPLAANFKEELPALYIRCKLNDIVTISAPLRYKTNAEYYLYKPNGDVTQLDIKPPILKHDKTETVVKFKNNDDKYFVWPKESFKTVNLNAGQSVNVKANDVFGVEKNDIVIGPVGEDDYGNWVLSLFATENGNRVEWFQVITLDITEYVPLTELQAKRSIGETLELGFAYPLKNLSSCQLNVPNTSYDRSNTIWILPPTIEVQSGVNLDVTEYTITRGPTSLSHRRKSCTQVLPSNFNCDTKTGFYERSSTGSCKFIIRNITLGDSGFWAIIGVGRITYWGKIYLRVTV